MLVARLVTGSAAETRDLGERIGRLLGPGAVVALEGELGAGKTVMAKGLCAGLGVADERAVASPTFTIAARHRGRCTVWHVDAYRLASGRELEALGAEEIFEGEAAAVVEWGDRVADALPEDRLVVRLSHEGGDRRAIEIEARGPRHAEALRDFAR